MSLADQLAINDKAVQDAVLSGTAVIAPSTGTGTSTGSTTTEDTTPAGLIATARTAKETGGITVDGLAIPTTLADQAYINGTVFSALLESDVTCALGAVTLTAAQVITVASELRKYLQACRARQTALLAAVTAGTYTAAMLTTGWPSNIITSGAA